MEGYDKQIASDPTQCAVCGTPFTAECRAIMKEFTGELYGFCSTQCITAFETDPEKYSNFDEDENGE